MSNEKKNDGNIKKHTHRERKLGVTLEFLKSIEKYHLVKGAFHSEILFAVICATA